ncbi:metal-dependent hydrolase, partial [Thermus sp.]|uniref:metal-dependent hydrolase n=1 Tax=Thermus sp. TaxID=275 RepID=UPI003D0CA287
MTAGTHLAGAALTAGILRGFGLEVGLPEGLALAWGSVMPDLDTTTSGPGKFARPLSAFLERRFGHRTLTHSLPFLLLLALLLHPLWRANPPVYWSFLAGYLSHLLLDTLNVNGVPLLWPWRAQFWMFAAREWRIRYASPQEATLALFLALSAFALWPLSGQGFASAFRHLVGTPEVAVLDYLDWRDRWEVWAEVRGFNRETQEPVEGRFLVVEALGREGFLVEDELGRTLAVSRDGQVVAYRARMRRGRPQVLKEWRLDLSGRLLADLLAALPRSARRVWITGEARPATAPPP